MWRATHRISSSFKYAACEHCCGCGYGQRPPVVRLVGDRCGMGVLQLQCQIFEKENDIKRAQQINSKVISDMERERLQSVELRGLMDNMKETVASLQRDIKQLQDVISDQKVSPSNGTFSLQARGYMEFFLNGCGYADITTVSRGISAGVWGWIAVFPPCVATHRASPQHSGGWGWIAGWGRIAAVVLRRCGMGCSTRE